MIKDSWPAVIAAILSIGLGYLALRIKLPNSLEERTVFIVSIRWSLGIAGAILGWIQALVDFIDHLLEGAGGVLWTILFVILLVGLLMRLVTGS